MDSSTKKPRPAVLGRRKEMMENEVMTYAPISVPLTMAPVGRYIDTKVLDVIGHETREGVAGYLVRYPDGYTSWSPWQAFEAAYRPMSAFMTFAQAPEGLAAAARNYVACQRDLIRARELDFGGKMRIEIEASEDTAWTNLCLAVDALGQPPTKEKP